jgi:hypothetical protein
VQVKAMIVCVGSNDMSIYEVADLMTKKGWSLNSLQNPAGLHLCCTMRHVGKEQQFIDDLRMVSCCVRVPDLTSGSSIQALRSQ